MSGPTLTRAELDASRYRWTVEAFLVAEAAGAFREQVELVDGEVWTVSSGRWHGRASVRCARLLEQDGVTVTQESLVTGESLPDPDLWVCPDHAQETGWVSPRISTWAPADVLLVVEVSDETVRFDLNSKARLYAAAGYAAYWVLTREALLVHTGPGPEGYKTVETYRAGEQIALPYGERTVAVSDLLG